MIIGGVNAAGRAGGMRCGYSESYLPCSVSVIHREIRDALESPSQTGLTFRATARIRSMDSSSWIDLGSASYFQVTRDNEGALDSADLTLQQPEVWSPYLLTWPDLLRPSNRAIQIRAGLVLSGTWYSSTVFVGHIKNYSESLGSSGGGISLRLEDARDMAARTFATSTALTQASSYRLLQAQQAVLKSCGFDSPAIRFTVKDSVLTADVVRRDPSGYPVLAQLSVTIPGAPLMQITGSGALKLGQEQTSETLIPAFAYSDRNIFVVNRRFSGDAQVNVVRVFGVVNGVGTPGEVQDSADVAKRGRIVYGAGFIGSPALSYSDAENLGREHIAGSLRGMIDMEIPFNPYLFPGMAISLQSDRLGISSTQVGKVYKIRHQYSVGRCRSYLSGLRTYQA